VDRLVGTGEDFRALGNCNHLIIEFVFTGVKRFKIMLEEII